LCEIEARMSLETYLRCLREAPELTNSEDYTLSAGEMNPKIFERFVSEVLRRQLPPVIWEPFAGTSHLGSSEVSAAQDYAEISGVRLLSFGLKPTDSRIRQIDSTLEGPNCMIGGMLFHPPYYGTVPLSSDSRDLSFVKDKKEYMRKLGMVVDNGIPFMVPNGLACVVGRSYRTGGQAIRLELIFLQLFESRGFFLKSVWKSEPDIVLIMCNQM